MPNRFAQTLRLLILQDDRIPKKRDGAINVTAAARAIGIQQPTLQRWLAGDNKDQRQENLQKAADYFRVSMDQLKGREPVPGAPRTARSSAAPSPAGMPTLRQTVADLYEQDSDIQEMFVAMYWAAKAVRERQLLFEGEVKVGGPPPRPRKP